MNITQGSKETILADIADRTNQLATLAGSNVRYDVKDKNGAYKMQDFAAVVVGMQAKCLIDTTLGGVWASGKYSLYVRFVDGVESPVMGPIHFSVNP